MDYIASIVTALLIAGYYFRDIQKQKKELKEVGNKIIEIMEKDDLIIGSISELRSEMRSLTDKVNHIEIKLALLQQKTVIYTSIAATVTMGIWQLVSNYITK